MIAVKLGPSQHIFAMQYGSKQQQWQCNTGQGHTKLPCKILCWILVCWYLVLVIVTGYSGTDHFASLSSFSSRYLKLSQPSSFFLHKLCLSISNFSLNPDWSKQSNLCSQSSTVRSSWVVASLRSTSWPSYTCFHFYTSNKENTNTHENTEENTHTKKYTNTDTKKDLHHLIYAFALTAPPVNTAQVHPSFNPNILEQRV